MKDVKEDEKILLRQRSVMIQTTIVKIMKGRRKLRHNDLINDTIRSVTSFRADPMLIKQQIEHLIETDFLVRDEKDIHTYIYNP
jgi:cullin 1